MAKDHTVDSICRNSQNHILCHCSLRRIAFGQLIMLIKRDGKNELSCLMLRLAWQRFCAEPFNFGIIIRAANKRIMFYSLSRCIRDARCQDEAAAFRSTNDKLISFCTSFPDEALIDYRNRTICANSAHSPKVQVIARLTSLNRRIWSDFMRISAKAEENWYKNDGRKNMKLSHKRKMPIKKDRQKKLVLHDNNNTYTEEMRSQATNGIFRNVRGEHVHGQSEGEHADLTIRACYPRWDAPAEHLQLHFGWYFVQLRLDDFGGTDLQWEGQNKTISLRDALMNEISMFWNVEIHSSSWLLCSFLRCRWGESTAATSTSILKCIICGHEHVKRWFHHVRSKQQTISGNASNRDFE